MGTQVGTSTYMVTGRYRTVKIQMIPICPRLKRQHSMLKHVDEEEEEDDDLQSPVKKARQMDQEMMVRRFPPLLLDHEQVCRKDVQ